MIKNINTNRFDNIFNKINSNIDDSTLGYVKTKILYEEFIKINNHSMTAEIGVYKGYTSKLISIMNYDNIHFCYDTFKGVIKSNESIDKVSDGSFNCCLDYVKNVINLPNVIYKDGIFPETFEEKNYSFSFVHSDTDTYFGAKATLNCFTPLMIIGGKILFDDYKWELCPGIEKAVDEFIKTNKDYELSEFEYQCVLTRRNKCL